MLQYLEEEKELHTHLACVALPLRFRQLPTQLRQLSTRAIHLPLSLS
jgi:hypothetical protein